MEVIFALVIATAGGCGLWITWDGLLRETGRSMDGRTLRPRYDSEATKYLLMSLVMPVLTHVSLVLLLAYGRATYQSVPKTIWLDIANSNWWYPLELMAAALIVMASFWPGKKLHKYLPSIFRFSFSCIFVWCFVELTAGATSPIRVGFLGPVFGLILSVCPLLLSNRWSDHLDSKV